MKDYISEAPEFSEVLRIIETSDLVNAEVPNVALKQLFHNTLCNRHWIKRLEKSTGDVGEYDKERAYKAGDYCLKQGNLYECIQDTTGEWDSNCWRSTNALSEITRLKSELKNLKEILNNLTESVNIVIPASGWSNAAPFANRVAVAGVKVSDNVDVTFIPTQGATNAQNITAWEGYTNINYSVTENGAIVFYALEEKPKTNVAVAVKGMARK